MHIGLESWIIQDGNYPDFEAGQKARFALAFYARSLRSTISPARQLRPIDPGFYEFSGVVVFRAADYWVLDAGLLAYSEAMPPDFAALGAAVTGVAYLGVDPFDYFEHLCKLPGMPELRYHWHIDSIQLETTPRISSRNAQGREVSERDESRRSFKAVERTDAWHDDHGNGHYILNCRQLIES